MLARRWRDCRAAVAARNDAMVGVVGEGGLGVLRLWMRARDSRDCRAGVAARNDAEVGVIGWTP